MNPPRVYTIRLFQSTRSESAFSNVKANSGWSLLNLRRGRVTLPPSLDRREHCTGLQRLDLTLHRGRNGACSAGMRKLFEPSSITYQSDAKDNSLLSFMTPWCPRRVLLPIYLIEALSKWFCYPCENTYQPAQLARPVRQGSARGST